MNNVNYNIQDITKETNIDENEIMNMIDIGIEKKKNDEYNDHIMASELYYNEYNKTELDKIAEYYNISKRKKRKRQLIKNIVQFECENEFITNRRKNMWFYISELENDEMMSKYVIFN
tara:strand:- start:19062 stop:19415 length:354 start_codon:yes stop_codon:yes gene_type:complete